MKTIKHHSFLKVVASVTIGISLLSGAVSLAGEQEAPATALERIARSRLFPEPILWVGQTAPSESEGAVLGAVLEQINVNNPTNVAQVVESYISSNPRSPWVPSLRVNLSRYYRLQGRYTLALNHSAAAWKATRQYDSGAGKLVADDALMQQSEVLGQLCQLDELEQLFETNTWKSRNGSASGASFKTTSGRLSSIRKWLTIAGPARWHGWRVRCRRVARVWVP